jgi:hypothetical protein
MFFFQEPAGDLRVFVLNEKGTLEIYNLRIANIKEGDTSKILVP